MAASTGGIKAGRAFVLIEAVDKTSMVLRRVSAKMRGFADRMTSLGRSMMTKGLAALTPAALSVRTFANFDDAMRKVEARSGATAAEIKNLRDQAKELGRTTSFTASQVGELQAKLAQKGFNPKQIQDMTASVMNLARAAGEGEEGDTTLSADLISGTIKAFGKEAKDAEDIANIFTMAVNNSNFSLEGLMDGMAKAGPLAASFGMEIDETAATLASMTNLNISASEAGTALQSFLARMSKEEFTSSFNKGLEELTGKTVKFRDAENNLRKPLEVFAELQDATKNLGTAERGDLLSILFGVRQFGKATGGMGGAVDAMELLSKLQKRTGTEAEDTAKKMDAGLGGAFRKAMSAVEGLAISIGEALSPALTGIVENLTEWLGTATEWVNKNRGLVTTVVAVVAGVVALGAGLMVAGFAVAALSVAFGGLATAIGVVKALFIGLVGIVTSPFTLIAVAIVAVIALLWKFSDAFRELFGGLGKWLREKFGAMADTVQTAFAGIVSAVAQGDLATAWAIIVDGATLVWLQFVDTLAEAWNNFARFFVETWVGVTSKFKELWFNAQMKIANGILDLAAQEGLLGDMLDMVIGVDVSAERKRSIELERQRLALAARRGVEAKPQMNAFDQAQQGIRDHFQGKIDRAQQDAADTLNAFENGVRDADNARNAEIAKRKQALEALVAEVQEREKLSEQLDEEGEDAGGPAMPELDPDLGLGGGGQGGSTPIPGISQGLEAGSVAAAQKAFENSQRKEADKQLAVQEDIHEELITMNTTLSNLATETIA